MVSSAAKVSAVGRDVASTDLGATLMHEHIFVLSPELRRDIADAATDDELVAFAVARLEEASAAGIGTIVDATIIGQGRDVGLLARVAASSPVHIVASTGVFVYEELPGYFRTRQPRGDEVDVLTRTFIRQVTMGIDGTPVRAGVVKCTTESPSPGPMAQRAIRAVGQAAAETGVPVISHTSATEGSGPVLAKLLIAEGAEPGRIAIGHCGDTEDLDYLRGLLDQGLVLGMDRFGHDYLLPHAVRLRTVAQLCRLGYAEQLVLSMDSPCFIDYYQDRPAGPADGAPFTTDYARMTRQVIPDLLEMGVAEDQVNAMMVTNPARFLPRR